MKLKTIVLLAVLGSAFFVFHSCKNKESTKEKTVSEQKIENREKEVMPDKPFQNKIDSADIRLEVVDSIISRDLKSNKMVIVNNSDYTLSTGSPYLMKYLEFGSWGNIPAIENAIWTHIEYIINPKSTWSKEFHFDFYDFDFFPGKYRIEKNVRIVNPDYDEDEQRNLRYLGERTLVADFEIK